MLSHPNEIFILHQGYWSGWKNKNKQNCNVGKTWLFCCMSSQMIFSDNFDILHFWWSKLWKGHEWNLLGRKEQRKKYRYTKVHTKGHLISKELFCFFNSSKRRTKNFCPNRLGQKFKFSSSFFGRIEDTRISFWD